MGHRSQPITLLLLPQAACLQQDCFLFADSSKLLQPFVMWFVACGRCLKARPCQIGGGLTTECWEAAFNHIGWDRWTSLRRASKISDAFLFRTLPGTLASVAQGLQAAASRIATGGSFPPLRGAENAAECGSSAHSFHPCQQSWLLAPNLLAAC